MTAFKDRKTGDRKKLEMLEAQSKEAFEEYDQYINQQMLKYRNLPKGTQASEEEVMDLVNMMASIGSASGAVKAQRHKMGLDNRKIIAFKNPG